MKVKSKRPAKRQRAYTKSESDSDEPVEKKKMEVKHKRPAKRRAYIESDSDEPGKENRKLIDESCEQFISYIFFCFYFKIFS